jgi:hypothetical protein
VFVFLAVKRIPLGSVPGIFENRSSPVVLAAVIPVFPAAPDNQGSHLNLYFLLLLLDVAGFKALVDTDDINLFINSADYFFGGFNLKAFK